jgi:hypothetical protein
MITIHTDLCICCFIHGLGLSVGLLVAGLRDKGTSISAMRGKDTKSKSSCLEQVTLLSRDEKDLLVVSYADVKRCLEVAFKELDKRAGAARSAYMQAAHHYMY